MNDYRYETLDIDFQHDYDWNARHLISWGLGYRYITDEVVVFY